MSNFNHLRQRMTTDANYIYQWVAGGYLPPASHGPGELEDGVAIPAASTTEAPYMGACGPAGCIEPRGLVWLRHAEGAVNKYTEIACMP